jgi:hypothetical protein
MVSNPHRSHRSGGNLKIFSFLVVVLWLTVASGAQTQTTSKATSSGPCSPAVSGNQNTFHIECKIDSAQGAQMIEILNKILSNQMDTPKVLEKLDEILKNINPNQPARTYFCNGEWKDVGPSADAAFQISLGGDDSAFKQMIELNNSRQTAVIDLCLQQIQSTPEWLTPRLFCAVGYFEIGDKTKATAMLKEFDARTGPAYSDGACKQMSDFLHQHLIN